MSSFCSFYNTFQKLLLNRLKNSKRKFADYSFPHLFQFYESPFGVITLLCFESPVRSHIRQQRFPSTSVRSFHFQPVAECVQDWKGKGCLQLQVWSWDLRGVVAAGSPGNTSGSWCIPAGVAAVNCACHSWGGAAWWQQGSWSFQHRVMEENEWAGIWGALHIISKVVLISCAMHCSNTCQALNFDISELLFATVLLWPEAVLIVSLQLTCQGQTLLIAFHVFFHKEFMETQALKNTSERTFRWSAKVMLECLLEGTSALTSQFRSSGIWSRWTKSEKMKPPKENSCSRICAGWPTPVCCPGGKGQEELQGRVWVHWPSYAGNLDSLIPLPDSCQEQFNARTLNLPTLCMYLLDLINGQTHLSPLVEKAWTMHV